MTEKDNTITLKRLASDEGYFTSVFKKTEKICEVISYILSQTSKSHKDSIHFKSVQDKTFAVHEVVLGSLSLTEGDATASLLDFQYSLLALESTLRLARAAGVISEEVLRMLLEQLDMVQRYINNHYTKNSSYSLDIGAALQSPTSSVGKLTNKKTASSSNSGTASAPRRKRVQIPAGDISTDAYLVYSQMTDRGERIKTVLEAKPQATIKDISEVITDVSEKTIQRELNSLIEKGQVVREGERRWSRYSAVKQ